jgi:hypothetical protein
MLVPISEFMLSRSELHRFGSHLNLCRSDWYL